MTAFIQIKRERAVRGVEVAIVVSEESGSFISRVIVATGGEEHRCRTDCGIFIRSIQRECRERFGRLPKRTG